MSTVMPQSELVKRAAAWIRDEREESGKTLSVLLEEAGMRFNLSPLDCAMLRDFFTTPVEPEQGSNL